MQTLSTIRPTFYSTLSLRVSRKHYYNNMADPEIPQQYPQKSLEICHCCLPWPVTAAKKPDAIA